LSEWSGISKYADPYQQPPSHQPQQQQQQHRFQNRLNSSPRSNSSAIAETNGVSDKIVAVHYSTFKRYLGRYLNDAEQSRTSKAKEKLLRLSRQQFQELSTDVFDEVNRRQDEGAFACLQDQPDFHPKRNQARQKLASLAETRFKELATDIFYEIERRFPGIGDELEPAMKQVEQVNGLQHKNWQEETITPNMSTMVEEEDDDRMRSDARSESLSPGSPRRNSDVPVQRRQIGPAHMNIGDSNPSTIALQKELNACKLLLQEKGAELSSLKATNAEVDGLRLKLKRSEFEKQSLQQRAKEEIATLKSQRTMSQEIETDEKYRSLQAEHTTFKAQLREQNEITEQVRREASQFLEEMKQMSENGALDAETEKLSQQILHLQEDVNTWKRKCSEARSQVRSLKASSVGFNQDSMKLKYAEFLSDKGAIRDSNLHAFQNSIDDLLRSARTDESAAVNDYMKVVITCARTIIQDVEKSEAQHGKFEGNAQRIKERVSATAHNLITAVKNHIAAKGLSPISLLDAAASHLTISVIDLVTLVKVRPTAVNGYGSNHSTPRQSQPSTPQSTPSRSIVSSLPRHQINTSISSLSSQGSVLRQELQTPSSNTSSNTPVQGSNESSFFSQDFPRHERQPSTLQSTVLAHRENLPQENRRSWERTPNPASRKRRSADIDELRVSAGCRPGLM